MQQQSTPPHGPPTRLTFRRLKIAYSWKCNAACEHCAVHSGPRRPETLGRDRTLTCIDAAAELGLGSIELTGGEIFLFWRELVAFMERAHEQGLEVFLNTNAFWAGAPDLARRRLAELKERGLQQIILSTDRYHQAFIPVSCIVNALDAASELGISASVTICYLKNDPSLLATAAVLYQHTPQIKFQPVAPFGRAAELPCERMARCSYASAGMPCDGLLAPTVSPDGRVTLCCAPPMCLSAEVMRNSPLLLGWLDREPLTQIIARAEHDPFLEFLASEGLGAILTGLNDLVPGLYQPRATGYFGPCDLCAEVLGSEPLLTRIGPLLPAVVRRSGRSTLTLH